MDFPIHLSAAVEMYDRLVEELSAVANPDVAATQQTIDLCHQFQTICRILLQIHDQDSTLLSEKQYMAISLSLKHAGRRIDQWQAADEDSDPSSGEHDQLLQVQWDRSSQFIHLTQEEDDNILDGWTNRAALEEEEAMLIALASTPIPSETDAATSTLRNKRDNACLNEENDR